MHNEDARLSRVHHKNINYDSFESVLDYVILGDAVTRDLNDRNWALTCYCQSEKYACFVMDYYLIGNSLFENLYEHKGIIDIIEKACKLVETLHASSTEVTLLANLVYDVTGDKESATELYKRALAIDQYGTICWDDRLFINRSIKENLKDHEWSEMILRQSTSVKEDPQNF